MTDLQVKAHAADLYSFDVFDTLITRTAIEPAGIFMLMQHILITTYQKYADIPEFVKNNFYTIRKETESFIKVNRFKLYGIEEITLEDIYSQIKLNMDLTSEQTQRLLDLELETELKNIVPIHENIDKLKEIAKNNRVVLISDMYLSAAQIRKLLVHADPIFENIPIYVSSEHKVSKTKFDLYKTVKEKEGVSYQNWTHFGDNKINDFKRASQLGINAKLLPQEKLLPYEKYALKQHKEDVFVQVLMGIAKATRTLSKNKSEKYQFGCSYVAPVLYSYVSWVIEKARSQNVKTLHFVARDGYVLKEIADIIIEQKKLNLKTKYIYGSRIAWRLPNKDNIDDYISWMCDEYRDRFSLDFLADRFNIETSELQKYTEIKNAKQRLRSSACKKLKKTLLESNELKEIIINKNKPKIDMLEQYLKTNLDTADNKIWFVDINGSGRTMDMLSDVIHKFYDGQIVSLYFHMSARSSFEKSLKQSYLATVNYMRQTIELLCRNLDGQTTGYKQKDSAIVPVLETVNQQNLLTWGFNDYLEGIRDYSRNAGRYESKCLTVLSSYNLHKLFFDFELRHLDKQTAEILGSIPYLDVGSEKKVQECAPKLNLYEGIKYLLTGKLCYLANYISVARTGNWLKLIDKFVAKYGSLRKFLCHVYVNTKEQTAYAVIFGIKISLLRFLRGKYDR